MSVAEGADGRLEHWLAPFAILFTRRTWHRILVLAAGTMLTTYRRTVSAALRVTSLEQATGFSRCHDVVSRSRWSALAASRLLLGLLVDAFVPSSPVVIGLDDTIERRWGAKIKVRAFTAIRCGRAMAIRRHLGGETQRQWSDKAIARTAPMLLGLFSLVMRHVGLELPAKRGLKALVVDATAQLT